MSKRPGRFKNLLISAAVVALGLAFIVHGEQISEAMRNFTGIPGFSKFPKIFSSVPNGKIQVHVIDVGQADSILIRSSDGNILIDAGTNGSEADLKAYLDACKVKTIDYLICTHPHYDHIGGADMIVDKYDVGTVLMSETEVDSHVLLESNGVSFQIPELDREYTLGEISFKILSPLEKSDDENDMSLVVKLTHGDMDFLFMGDASTPTEKLLLEKYTDHELDCEFLKVGHHGAETASSAEFLAAVTPQIAAISCEEYNDYGHPRGEVLDRLADASCETVLRTDKMGTVVVSSDGSEITVMSQ